MNIKDDTKKLANAVKCGEVFNYDSEYWMRVNDDDPLLNHFDPSEDILAVSIADGMLLEVSKHAMVTILNSEVFLK